MTIIDIGNKIKNRREVLKITQQNLADLVKISRQNLSSIENGESNVSIQTLLDICNKLNLELNIDIKRI